MELESPWRDSKSTDWLRALSLPTLGWAGPFLPLLGLPRLLLEHKEVWESIYAQAVTEHESRLKSGNWAVGIEGGRGKLMRQVVTKALRQLAEQMRRDVAVDLERWVRFHFFCPEARSAMSEWSVVLSYAYLPENSHRGRRKVILPTALIPLLSEISDLVNDEQRREVLETLKRVAPPPTYEQIPYENMEHCYEATMIYWALNQALTLKALQTIARRLNDMEREEVVVWAQIQMQTMSNRYGHARSEKLCGSKYLLAELPCADIPSVLDIPDPNPD